MLDMSIEDEGFGVCVVVDVFVSIIDVIIDEQVGDWFLYDRIVDCLMFSVVLVNNSCSISDCVFCRVS